MMLASFLLTTVARSTPSYVINFCTFPSLLGFPICVKVLFYLFIFAHAHSYLKFYTTMPLAKLAAFMDIVSY